MCTCRALSRPVPRTVAVAVASSSKRPSEPTRCRHRLQQHRTQVRSTPTSPIKCSSLHSLASISPTPTHWPRRPTRTFASRTPTMPSTGYRPSTSAPCTQHTPSPFVHAQLNPDTQPNSIPRTLSSANSHTHPSTSPDPTSPPSSLGVDFCCISRSAAASSVPRCTRNGQGDVDGSGLFCHDYRLDTAQLPNPNPNLNPNP